MIGGSGVGGDPSDIVTFRYKKNGVLEFGVNGALRNTVCVDRLLSMVEYHYACMLIDQSSHPEGSVVPCWSRRD